MSFLSDQSGIYFVYSSNKIDVGKTISLTVKDKTLAQVLGLIGKQVDLVFRIEGHHVTIKGDETAALHNSAMTSVSRKTKTPVSIETLPTANEPVIKYYAPQVPPTAVLLSTHANLRKEFERLQPYFDSSFLKHVPPKYIRRLNSRNTHSGLFFSAGAMLNDYSSGLELQAGIRQIYAVFSPGWLRDGDFHPAYGLGSSFHLTHNFSFNPVYLFGTVTGSESYFRINKYSHPSQVLVQHRTQHHQLKLMLQYALAPNFAVKLGPTLNRSSTTFKYHETPIVILQVVRGDPFSHDAQFHTVSYGGSAEASTTTGRTPIERDYHTRNLWIGWEASISFKLNFFPHKIVAPSH